MTNKEQINKRRIFGIISHPDAGKTTLTEKLLLHGGAIREAGSVRARKNSKYAKSDWMEIEKQRGISVTSSVMQFEYNDKVISIMDTPGHNDFGEDTYRILTSVDSAVMVIDAAKGIEAQTKKLFQVCSMRGIPIFTFINKLDRHGMDPLDLTQELEDVLGLPSVAVTWPIGAGKEFEGVYDRLNNTVYLFRKKLEIKLDDDGVHSTKLDGILNPGNLEVLRDAMDLLDGAGNEFNIEEIKKGKLSPVFFGSALADFGVTEFLNHFLSMSPPPTTRKTTTGVVTPTDDVFTGFIFKIQANMNPNHRDRLAFMRICSGTFTRGMNVTLARTGKQMKLSQSTHLMANERETVDIAYAGDVIGIYDTGNFQIGDTLMEGKEIINFEPLPTFPPELFSRVSAKNSLKGKNFQKGVEQLAQEGAIQVYKNQYNEVILGAVGVLQFEVFEYRLVNEYNTEIRMENIDFTVARWVKTKDSDSLKKYQNSRCMLVFDHYERPVLLFTNQYALRSFQDRYEDIELVEALNVNDVIVE
ncbi:peptide chain release factor 3 [Sedimentibacter sp. MB31-C6]|uniref:peptide chain release factor 3 n=1 Tax=Sedimentibacter sp. MB31-C6 TaxID=3109366 RepID=UPI002DDD5BFC|nr:peptide chain release factor 3 [Sedimentibacter sp. MB36-C1]WSI04225.1 peptide chain release factor 3 [Sedimentibacter sp. MB36-C1]